MSQFIDIIEILRTLQDDVTVPKNIRLRVQETVTILESSEESSIKINKALNELEDLADDSNMQSYIRTQLWNVVSSLEKLTAL